MCQLELARVLAKSAQKAWANLKIIFYPHENPHNETLICSPTYYFVHIQLYVQEVFKFFV